MTTQTLGGDIGRNVAAMHRDIHAAILTGMSRAKAIEFVYALYEPKQGPWAYVLAILEEETRG